MPQKVRILSGGLVTMTGSPVDLGVETLLGSERLSPDGADLYLSAPSGNADPVEILGEAGSHGILLPAGQVYIIPNAHVADGAWRAIGTASDTLKVCLVGGV